MASRTPASASRAAVCPDHSTQRGRSSSSARPISDATPGAVHELAPVRARRAEYARDLGYVRQVLRDGNERANEIAAATLAEVQAALGMRY